MTLLAVGAFIALATATGAGLLRNAMRDLWTSEEAYEAEANDWI